MEEIKLEKTADFIAANREKVGRIEHGINLGKKWMNNNFVLRHIHATPQKVTYCLSILKIMLGMDRKRTAANHCVKLSKE